MIDYVKKKKIDMRFIFIKEFYNKNIKNYI